MEELLNVFLSVFGYVLGFLAFIVVAGFSALFLEYISDKRS